MKLISKSKLNRIKPEIKNDPYTLQYNQCISDLNEELIYHRLDNKDLKFSIKGLSEKVINQLISDLISLGYKAEIFNGVNRYLDIKIKEM